MRMYKIGMKKLFECPKCGSKEMRTLVKIQGYVRKWERPGGYVHSEKSCYPCVLKRNKRFRDRTVSKKAYSKAREYIRSPKGLIIMKYAGIQARCAGTPKKTAHIYKGLPYEEKRAFYDWALNHPEFKRLYKIYKREGFRRRYAPSVDRIDSSLGYTFDNMQWLPNGENAAKSMLERWKKFKSGDRTVFGKNPNLPD
jgi:hypothetical protein